MHTIDDCKVIPIPTFEDNGFLNVLEFYRITFIPKRMFYIYGVEKVEARGNHAHYKTEQFLICLKGECGVGLFDGKNTKDISLSNPRQGLYIPEMIWDTQVYSKDAILLVLASTHYNKDDYITDYEEFKRMVNG